MAHSFSFLNFSSSSFIHQYSKVLDAYYATCMFLGTGENTLNINDKGSRFHETEILVGKKK